MTEYIGRGSISNLSSILDKEKSQNLLIFTGKVSFQKNRNLIEKLIGNRKITYYSDFSCNPKLEDVNLGLSKLVDKFDIIIAIGGGSVIDFAKCYRFLGKKHIKLIAIPTTAGTGSEVTQFSVLYVDNKKTSLDSTSILPEYAICDSQFLNDSPRYLKACTAMDAFSHAIESYWAVKSTEESRKYAREAIILCRDNIKKYVNSNDKEIADNMALAANLAGHAINITRTTAAHALSYDITSKYNIPHGHAVSLNLERIFTSNLNINESNCNDPRGVPYVKEVMNTLSELLSTNTSSQSFIKSLVEDLFKDNPVKIDHSKLSINKERLRNNPVHL